MSVSVKPTRCAPPRPRPSAVGGSCASREADRGGVPVRDGRAADVHDTAPARRIRIAVLALSTTNPSNCGLVSLNTASPASPDLVAPVRHPVSSRPSVINRASTTRRAKWIKNTGRVAPTVAGTGSAAPPCRVERIRVLRARRRHEARVQQPRGRLRLLHVPNRDPWVSALAKRSGPSARQIADGIRLSSTSTVACHLGSLETQRGALVRDGHGRRTCRPVR